METPEQVLRKRWAEDELDRLYPMIFSSDHSPATYPERSLYYRDEVKAVVEEIERERDRASQQRDRCRETASYLSAQSVPDIKAAVNEELERAAKSVEREAASFPDSAKDFRLSAAIIRSFKQE